MYYLNIKEKWHRIIKKKYSITFLNYEIFQNRILYISDNNLNTRNANNNDKPKKIINIIAVTHERHGELKTFVQSIINQSQENWTLHIIHDGYNKIFVKIMKKFISENSSKISYECSNVRFNDYGHSLREIGLKKADGDYVLITNADNYYVPKTLNFINQVIHSYTTPKPDVVMFDMIHSHENAGKTKAPSYSYFKVGYKRNRIDMGSALVERHLAQRAGFDDKSYAADASYFEKILDEKNKSDEKLFVVKIPRVLLVHN